MSFGKSISIARKRQDMTQDDLSQKINYSRESVAKYENGTRKMPKEIYPHVIQGVDDPELYFQSWQETTGFVSIPFFNGDNIDQHPASLAFLVKKETDEALEQLEITCWSKPARSKTDDEREQMKQVLIELLDSAASMINLVACICREYKFSMKDIFRAWNVSLKIRKFNK
ncbi:helix-turn-helix domain-containing protein [Neobacillus sp. WH10]|uniref:helix-turn-helix transcriptional regulator n=1 Tax=Neobacillus sp. WH10 TaxID=3047873 RepID=UPI0024C0F8AF|nr:helix-turn-helix domain-containing protein [Neobacillus sp. WH10]WHY76263.1 helix-turn-helix domain-containing protein [Neobacillus sp. WH10]